MAELKCAAVNCTYNKDHYCSKGDIMVGGSQAEKIVDTCCESFVDKSRDSYKSALDHPSKTISIDCEACKCIHNSDYKCHAQSVNIGGSNACSCRDTECDTFSMER